MGSICWGRYLAISMVSDEGGALMWIREADG